MPWLLVSSEAGVYANLLAWSTTDAVQAGHHALALTHGVFGVAVLIGRHSLDTTHGRWGIEVGVVGSGNSRRPA
jgi:hypothetical protein